MRFETGDVVWAPDPYHGDDPDLTTGAGRPWVIISTERFPRQGQDYICCALTSSKRQDPDFIPLDGSEWVAGGVPRPTRIDPQTVMVIKERWILLGLGRLRTRTVERARERVRGYL